MNNGKIKFLVLVVLAGGSILSPLRNPTAQAATIRADADVNVRLAASGQSKKIGTIPKGQTIDLIGFEKDWYQILWNGQIGYTSMNYWSGNTVTAKANVNLRQAADSFAPILGQVKTGAEVIVLGRSGAWLYIEYQGITGFSHRDFWDVSDTFFDHLPYILGEMTEASLASFAEANLSSIILSAGDQYRIIYEVPTFATSADAKSGKNPMGHLPSGSYFITKAINGIYNLSTDPQKPGSWIDPASNIGRITPIAVAVPQPRVIEQPIKQTWNVGESVKVYLTVPGYSSAADALARKNPGKSVVAGDYLVSKFENGMINISTSKEKPVAWINPEENTEPVQSPPVKTPGSNPAPQTPPALEAGHSAMGDQVVAEARKLLGAPYIYGAESWAEVGFDCSGLTQYVYGQVGIDIPRTASYQWAGISRKVTVPRPGDLVVFAKVEEGGVYHIGVYIGGNQMIHAPKPGDHVKISSLDWYYNNGWVKGYLRPYKD